MSAQVKSEARGAGGKLEGIEQNRLGVILFLLNEAVFFAMLIIAFITYRNQVKSGPNVFNSLDVGVTAIYTVFLLSSSLTMWLAERSLEHGSQRGMVIWLIVTIVLGGVFLVGQGIEYTRLLTQNITVSRNLFGTTFFTLTGFHGLHVLVGLIMMAILAGLTIAWGAKGRKSAGLGAIAIYWHFVDAVWVVIFSLVYLWTLIG